MKKISIFKSSKIIKKYMNNNIKSIIIILITLIFIAVYGGGRSSMDDNLIGWWQGITEHGADNCPTYMNFTDEGRFITFWLNPANETQAGGWKGTYSTGDSSITINITHEWSGVGAMNWKDIHDDVNISIFTIRGNCLTMTTEYGNLHFYKGTEPVALESMSGTWKFEDESIKSMLTFDYGKNFFKQDSLARE